MTTATATATATAITIRDHAFMDECEAIIDRLAALRDQIRARTPAAFAFTIKERESREAARAARVEGKARVAALQAAIDATLAAMANLNDDGSIDLSHHDRID